LLTFHVNSVKEQGHRGREISISWKKKQTLEIEFQAR
jgi:hypothetical protein